MTHRRRRGGFGVLPMYVLRFTCEKDEIRSFYVALRSRCRFLRRFKEVAGIERRKTVIALKRRFGS